MAKFQVFLWGSWQSCQFRFPKSNKSLLFFNHLDNFLFCLINIYSYLLLAFSDFNPQSAYVTDESNSDGLWKKLPLKTRTNRIYSTTVLPSPRQEDRRTVALQRDGTFLMVYE